MWMTGLQWSTMHHDEMDSEGIFKEKFIRSVWRVSALNRCLHKTNRKVFQTDVLHHIHRPAGPSQSVLCAGRIQAWPHKASMLKSSQTSPSIWTDTCSSDSRWLHVRKASVDGVSVLPLAPFHTTRWQWLLIVSAFYCLTTKWHQEMGFHPGQARHRWDSHQ